MTKHLLLNLITTSTLATTEKPDTPDQDPATSKTQGPEHPDPTDTVPQQITAKRPHFPSGETVQPQHQKPKSQTAASDPQLTDAMEVDHTNQTPHDQNTVTSDTTDPSYGGLQHPFLLNERPDVPDPADYQDRETIPDAEYQFDLTHSQPTRLEVLDALAVAQSISPITYQRTLDYVQTGGYLDISYLQSLSKHNFPQHGAHNNSTASPIQPK